MGFEVRPLSTADGSFTGRAGHDRGQTPVIGG